MMNPSDLSEHYPICYVVADDDQEELLLMRMAFERQRKPLPVREFTDGKEVVDYLQYNSSIRNDEDTHWLLVLDMHMPRLNGLETLKAIRQNHDWDPIPVLIFTDQANEQIRQEVMANGGNGCLVKPNSLDGYKQLFDEFFSPFLVDQAQ